ncbi:DUF636 domain-containing protein [Coprinopsis cinerea AmutBmut pab1-1]|nr:DUF636 domain-containing protein [Coprinopsis cinerea AmutBmut pab1-1]
METKTYDGNCLCGGVAWQIQGEPFTYVICHCVNCKKSGGGPFQANAFFKPQNVNVIKGKDLVKDYVDGDTKSGNAITRSFCSNCGSSLFISPAAGGITIVHSANIKGSEAWVPRKEFFGHDKCNWLGEIKFQPKKVAKL